MVNKQEGYKYPSRQKGRDARRELRDALQQRRGLLPKILPYAENFYINTKNQRIYAYGQESRGSLPAQEWAHNREAIEEAIQKANPSLEQVADMLFEKGTIQFALEEGDAHISIQFGRVDHACFTHTSVLTEKRQGKLIREQRIVGKSAVSILAGIENPYRESVIAQVVPKDK
jgi:hypothetical protein